MGLASLVGWIVFPHVGLSRAALRRALAGKTVVITGASFGIGEEAARLLAAAGARVILVARTADKLEALVSEIVAGGGVAFALPADLRDEGQVETLLARIAELGPVDILVSNAGKSIRRPLFASLDRFQDITRTIGVNYLGPARIALGLIPGLVARKGQIVSVCAANVLLPPPPYWAPYQASKSAFDQWLRCGSAELRARGVAVTSIYLPLVRTRMIAPTAQYSRVPAMAPAEAGRLVARMVLTRQSWWTPWWLPPAHIAGALLRGPWEWITNLMQRRALSR